MLDKQKAALNEILAVAPVAVSNLAHTYNPSSGTLDTRDNLGGTQNLLDPAVICSALTATGNLPASRHHRRHLQGDRQAARRAAAAERTRAAACPACRALPGLPPLGGS